MAILSESEMFDSLIEVVRALAAARALDEVTGAVRRAARRLTGADGVTVVVRDKNQCEYVDEEAISPLWKGRRFPLWTCVSGWVMEHGEPAAIADVYADSRVLHEAYRPTFVKSLALVPVGSPAVAAIGAYWASTHEATAYELRVLRALADAAFLGMTKVGVAGDPEPRVAPAASLRRRRRPAARSPRALRAR